MFLSIWLVLGMFVTLSHSETDRRNKEMEMIKKQKETFLFKILEVLKTRKPVDIDSEQRLRSCRFETEVSSLRSGVCTRAGACRVHSQDFMYQGGCGEVTGWGQMAIPDNPPCSMLVTSIEKLEGFCTRSGHCWAAFKTKLLHPDCRSYITLVQG